MLIAHAEQKLAGLSEGVVDTRRPVGISTRAHGRPTPAAEVVLAALRASAQEPR